MLEGMAIATGPLAAIERRHGDYVLTVSEVARILAVSTRTVWRLVEVGKLSAIRQSERRRGILASEVSRYMNEA